jgi:hypothetical protein
MNYPDEVNFLRKYNFANRPPLNKYQKKNINNWIPLLRKCVPTKSQKAAELAGQPGQLRPLRESQDNLDRTHALMGCLRDARGGHKFELLTHLGFELNEWSTVHSLLDSMINTYELLQPHMPPKTPSPGLDWNRPYRIPKRSEREALSSNSTDAKEPPITAKVSLDKLTAGTKEGSLWKWTRLEPVASDKIPLDTLTVEPAARFFGDRILAEVLANLGSMALVAAESPLESSQLAMSCLFRTLARLHHAGMISDRVYQYPTPDASQIIFRPPGLHLLSSPIMSVLSDAAWHEHEAAVAAAAADAGELSPFIPYKMGIRELGPEIWLELILWCCVEHGFCKTGALLVHRMARSSSKQSWKTDSWGPLIQDLDTVQQTNISVEESWRRPGKAVKPVESKRGIKPPFNGLGYRTISTEVVDSLISGLSNKAYVGLGDRGYLPMELENLSAPLTRFITPQTAAGRELCPTNKHTNWQTLRILNSGCLQPWSDPVAFESLLRSHPNVVPPWEVDELKNAQELDSATRAQIYDETAAIFGLIEYNLNYYARQKQSGRLFYEYAWLQNISDASKAQHMQSFFEKLSQAREEDLPFFDSKSVLPESSSQTSIPQVSHVTFANLLDVATSGHAFDFGHQLLSQNEMDGTAIPESAYGNQALAPSILRFATATKDADLGRKVIGSLSVPLSVNTIKHLINYHISRCEWDRVELMLNFLVNHRSKSWGYSNLAALAGTIIRLEATLRQKTADNTVTDTDVENTRRAADIMLRLYRGEWQASTTRDKVRLFQLRTLSRMHRVLISIPGPLPEIFRRLEVPKEITSHHKVALIPPASFNELFVAIVETQGCIVGKQVWDQHCIDWLSPKSLRQAPGGVTRLLLSHERRKELGDPNWNAKWANQILTKSAIANLDTVRVLARAAVREYSAASYLINHSKTFDTNSPPLPASPSFTDKPKKPFVLSISPKDCPYQLFDGSPPRSEIEAILDFCLVTFIRLGLTEDQIEVEIPGHFRRMQSRGVLHHSNRQRLWWRMECNKNDPWIESVWWRTPEHAADKNDS